ncbi:16S rRNA (guanine(527)-N(7))-methyltransferase RsmG [Candidatus Sumerlaeota bacterium]|nr:16S rRNA (guanine(527)-N(7))-methyltransferase RsmG [Candidatus Sumerlaeota bacterium]
MTPTSPSRELIGFFQAELAELPECEAAPADLAALCEAVHEQNQRANVTAARSPLEIAREHVLDALTLIPAIRERLPECDTPQLIDVGAGGGFPGLPLALALPQLRVTLLDSIEKKCRAARAAADAVPALAESGCVEVIRGRAEDWAREDGHREQYDFATARAVGACATQAELTLPFLRIGGWLLLQKGAAAAQEIESATGAIEILGGRLEFVQTIERSGQLAPRLLAGVRKAAHTPEKYPRRSGLPSKRPL